MKIKVLIDFILKAKNVIQNAETKNEIANDTESVADRQKKAKAEITKNRLFLKFSKLAGTN